MLEAGWARIHSLLGRGKEPLVESTYFMFRRMECWRPDGRGSTASWAEARSLLSTVHTLCLGGWNAGGRMGEDQQPPGQKQGASCRQYILYV